VTRRRRLGAGQQSQASLVPLNATANIDRGRKAQVVPEVVVEVRNLDQNSNAITSETFDIAAIRFAFASREAIQRVENVLWKAVALQVGKRDVSVFDDVVEYSGDSS
jgi:rRNA maturation endonuclease Nob1